MRLMFPGSCIAWHRLHAALSDTSHREGGRGGGRMFVTVSANDQITQQTTQGAVFPFPSVTQKRQTSPPLTATHANVPEEHDVTFTSSERKMGWVSVCVCMSV